MTSVYEYPRSFRIFSSSPSSSYESAFSCKSNKVSESQKPCEAYINVLVTISCYKPVKLLKIVVGVKFIGYTY